MKRIPMLLLTALSLVACAKKSGSPATANSAAGGAAPVSFPQFQKQETATAAERGAPAPTAEEPGCGQDCQAMRQEFRYVVYVGKQIYCYWEEKRSDTGRDFDALAKELENSLTDRSTLSDYFLVLRRWASAFHDGHVNAMTGDDVSALEIYSSGVRLEVFAPATDHEKVVAVAGLPNGKIKAGDEVLEVNGKPVADALSEAAEKLSSGSTARMRRYSAARRLVDVLGSANAAAPFELKIRRAGQDSVVALSRKAELNLPPDATAKPEDDDGSKSISVSVMPGGIGYMKIDVFLGKMDKLIDLAMDRLQPTKGLVIDMRQNGGGDQSGNKIIARMIEQKVVRYKQSVRVSDFLLSQRPEYFFAGYDPTQPFTEWMDRAVQPAPAEKAYLHKPVVVLTGPYCFSACDTFTSAMKVNKLATLIGEGTGGGTGTPLVFDLPVSGLKFRYSVARGRTFRDEVIEGAGTLPDIFLEPTVADRLGGKDGQLDFALDFVSQQAHVTPPPAESRPQSLTEQRTDLSPTAADVLMVKKLSHWEKSL